MQTARHRRGETGGHPSAHGSGSGACNLWDVATCAAPSSKPAALQTRLTARGTKRGEATARRPHLARCPARCAPSSQLPCAPTHQDSDGSRPGGVHKTREGGDALRQTLRGVDPAAPHRLRGCGELLRDLRKCKRCLLIELRATAVRLASRRSAIARARRSQGARPGSSACTARMSASACRAYTALCVCVLCRMGNLHCSAGNGL